MQVPRLLQAWVKSAVGRTTGPVKVEFAGVVQLTWNFHTASSLGFAPRETRVLGAPAGGSRVPSRSAGRRPLKLLLVLKHCCVAARPASMLARSEAQTLGPAKGSASGGSERM